MISTPNNDRSDCGSVTSSNWQTRRGCRNQAGACVSSEFRNIKSLGSRVQPEVASKRRIIWQQNIIVFPYMPLKPSGHLSTLTQCKSWTLVCFVVVFFVWFFFYRKTFMHENPAAECWWYLTAATITKMGVILMVKQSQFIRGCDWSRQDASLPGEKENNLVAVINGSAGWVSERGRGRGGDGESRRKREEQHPLGWMAEHRSSDLCHACAPQ